MLSSVDDYIERKLVHEIHTSERKSYRACRRRWNWIFRQNRYPYITAKPLEFGTAFHIGYETYYDPTTWHLPRPTIAQLSIKRFVDKCEAQRKAFLDLNDTSYLEDDVQTDYDERVELGKGMLRHYFDNIAPKYDQLFTPVKVEIAFMVIIDHPDTKEVMWCRCDQCAEKWHKHFGTGNPLDDYLNGGEYWQGLPVVYAGRCDMLAVDGEGHLWIFDWKSARVVSIDKEEFLELDDQVGTYVWALRKLGLDVRGFVYHEQRKGYPRVPERNKVCRLGRWYSVNKNQETDYETYLRTVSTEDEDAYKAGLYDEFLTYLREEGVVYFHRWQIHKSQYQCEQIELNVGYEALEIIDPKLRIYPSPGRFGCNSCAFRQPCLEQNAGGDYQYALDTLYEVREHYYVRPEPTTEARMS